VSDRKRCTQCNAYKLLRDYSPCRNGLQPACKACRNATARAKPAIVPVASKECASCKQELPAASFWRSRHNAGGLQAECKQCSKARKAGVHYPVTLVEKTCKDCGSCKPAAEFCVHTKRVGGLRSECRDCTNIRARARVYRLELGSVKEMRARAACDICGGAFLTSRGQHIDHCHETGLVRGVLCGNCNRMLGGARDSSRILLEAAQYLSRTGTDKAAKEGMRA
jgi:hypothetical protein